jgi:DNA-binding CsgD family transcriptional regulator
MAVGHVAAQEERHEDALEAFLAAGRRLDALLVTNPTVIPWRSEAGLMARRLGRESQARQLIDEELALAQGYGASYAIGIAQTAAGLLERGEDSVGRLREAAALLTEAGAPIARSRALAHLGAAVRRAGRPVDARGVLREAIAAADGAGAIAVARAGRDELRLAGGRAPAASAGDGLTPSERRVAERAAEGESNRDIAAALFLTVKSVEWHLGNTYRKLGIRGRGELAASLHAP